MLLSSSDPAPAEAPERCCCCCRCRRQRAASGNRGSPAGSCWQMYLSPARVWQSSWMNQADARSRSCGTALSGHGGRNHRIYFCDGYLRWWIRGGMRGSVRVWHHVDSSIGGSPAIGCLGLVPSVAVLLRTGTRVELPRATDAPWKLPLAASFDRMVCGAWLWRVSAHAVSFTLLKSLSCDGAARADGECRCILVLRM